MPATASRRRTPAGRSPRASRHRRGRRVRVPLAAVATGLALAILLAPQAWEGSRARSAARAALPLPHHHVVRQSHPRGCGAALLATLLQRRGLDGDEAALLAAAPPGPDGISLAGFARLAAAHGLAGRWYGVTGDRLPATPFVAHLDRPEGHFVWVASRAGAFLRVADPAGGEAVWHVTALRSRFSGRFFRIGSPS